MTFYRRPTLKTALWLMLMGSLLFAGDALVGGGEWRRPAHNFGGGVTHSFAIAFTTQMLFWLALPTVVGMVAPSLKWVRRICGGLAIGVLGVYLVAAHYDGWIFGYSDLGHRTEVVTLSALFGPLLAVEVPAMMAESSFDGPLIFLMIYGIWLGFFMIAADQIFASLRSKPVASLSDAESIQ